MYFLVYLIPASGGSGSGIAAVALVLIALGLLVALSTYSLTWMVAPAALTLALLESGSLWWWLLVLVAVGVVINLLSAKLMDGHWQPLLSAAVLILLSAVIIVGGLLWEVISGKVSPAWYEWLICIVAVPILIPFIALTFYSHLNAWVSLTSPATLWMGMKPCLGALCSVVGMIGAVLFSQGLMEGIFSWFGENPILESVQAHLESGTLEFLTFNLVSEEKNVHILRRMEDAIDAIARIPAWWRCLLGLGLTIGCGVGEFNCSRGLDMF